MEQNGSDWNRMKGIGTERNKIDRKGMSKGMEQNGMEWSSEHK